MEAPAASRVRPEDLPPEIQARQRLMLCMHELIRDLGQANADLVRELDRRQRMTRKLARELPEPVSPDETGTLLVASGQWSIMNVAEVPPHGEAPAGGASIFTHLGKALRDPARLFVSCLRPVPRWELLADRVGRVSANQARQLAGLALDLVCLRLAEPVFAGARRRVASPRLTETAAIMVTDINGYIRLANRRLCSLAGLSGQEVLGRPWFRLLLPEEDWPMARKLPGFPALIALSEHELWIKGGTGAVVRAKWFSAPLNRNCNPVGAVTVLVTENAEPLEQVESLVHRERFYRRVLDEQGAGRFICAPDGQLLDCNEAFARIFGYPSAPEAIGCNLRPLHRDDAAAAQFGDALRRDGRIVSFDITMCRVDGQMIKVDCYASAATDDQGELRDIAGLVFDMTSPRQREQRSLPGQGIETVGWLAGGVAQYFNNLLSVIQGFAELLAGQVSENGPALETTREIQQAAGRAATLTRRLLAFGQRQVLQPIDLQLNDIVGDIVLRLQTLLGQQVELVTDLAPDLGLIRADRAQLEEALTILTANARDALPRGGRVTIATRNVRSKSSRGAAEHLVPEVDQVELTVADNGGGMTEEVSAHLFEPFFTTKEPGQGAGLGLPAVYGIVNQNGGAINVRSVKGEGVRVRMVFPQSRVKATKPELVSAAKPRSGQTILLVDDEASVRRLLKQVLVRAGFRVVDCRSGAEALAAVERTEIVPDLLVTDLIMPGLGGRELWERVRRRRPDLPVVYLSGDTDASTIKNGATSPHESFLPKPFKPEALVEKVAATLDAR